MISSGKKDTTYTAWSIPTLNLKNELLDPTETFITKPYTILDPAHVLRNAKELAELIQVYPEIAKDGIIKLVTFKPERLILHALMVNISINLKINNEEQLQAVILNYHNQLKSDIKYHNITSNALQKRQTIEGILNDLLKNKNNSMGIFEDQKELILQKFSEFQELIEKQSPVFGKYVKGYRKENALVSLATDALYKDLIVPELNAFVQVLIAQVIEENPKLKINIPESHERLTVMIAGGQASGKTGAYNILKEKLNLETWVEYVKLDTDAFKGLLLLPGSVNQYLFSQLVQHEASFIRDQIQAKLVQLVKEQKAPNVYIDQVFVGPNELDFSLEGKGVVAVVVSTRVEDAIERSFARGEKVENQQGRFEHTQGVLWGHKGVAVNFFNDVFNYSGKKILLDFYDNNVPLPEPPVHFMHLDLANKKLIIHDEKKFKAFVKKMLINMDATDAEHIYPENSDELTEKLYNNIITQFKENEFVLLYKQKEASLPGDVESFKALREQQQLKKTNEGLTKPAPLSPKI